MPSVEAIECKCREKVPVSVYEAATAVVAACGTKPQETNCLKWPTEDTFYLKATLEVITS